MGINHDDGHEEHQHVYAEGPNYHGFQYDEPVSVADPGCTSAVDPNSTVCCNPPMLASDVLKGSLGLAPRPIPRTVRLHPVSNG